MSKAGTGTWSSDASSEPATESPECPICNGAGFVHPLLPTGRPDFGRVVPCRCNRGGCEQELQSRLRRDSGDLGLPLLRSMTFDAFDCRRINLPAQQQRILGDAFRLAQRFAEEPEGWLVLQGPNGCGKTHLAAAIGNRQLEKGSPVFFTVVPDLLDYLRAAFGPESTLTYDEVFERVRSAPLLILDDFGEQASTPWAQEKLYQVMNYRYNARLPTVITSSFSLDEIETRLSSRMVDPSISTVFNIDVPDFRGDFTPSERRGRQSLRPGRRR